MAFKNLNCTVEVSGLEDTGADAGSERLIEILESFLPSYTEGLGRWLGNQTILVTGAAGSIGSELCRQLLHHGPASEFPQVAAILLARAIGMLARVVRESFSIRLHE